MLQWEWLGGLAPIRRAAIVGAGSWGTSLAVGLARAGLEVDLACRTHEQAEAPAVSRENESYLPGGRLPDSVRVMRAADLRLGGHDLVCLAVPARSLPGVLAAHGERIPQRAGVLVLSKGLVPPLGTLPSAFVAERCRARAVAAIGGRAHAADVLELASCATNVAALAAAAAAWTGRPTKPARRRERGSRRSMRSPGCRVTVRSPSPAWPATSSRPWSPPARATGAPASCSPRVPPQEIGLVLGQVAEAVDPVPLTACVGRDAQLETPAIDSLAALVEEWIEPTAGPRPSPNRCVANARVLSAPLRRG